MQATPSLRRAQPDHTHRRTRAHRWRTWSVFRSNGLAVPAIVVLGSLIILAAGAPLFAEYVTQADPNRQRLLYSFESPSWTHWLGTDEYGRDVFTRLLYGGRVSLGVAALASIIMALLGTLVGATAAFYGGVVDAFLMDFVNLMLCIPTFYFLIFLSSMIAFGPVQLAFAIALLSWFGLARLVRSEALSIRDRLYVDAARVTGASNVRILMRHIIPNISHIVLMALTSSIPGFLLSEAALSYLGLGIQPPNASWGNMLNGATQYLYNSPGLIIYPGIAITVTVVCTSILGNALRDALDPKSLNS